jgi:hypothetical protein
MNTKKLPKMPLRTSSWGGAWPNVDFAAAARCSHPLAKGILAGVTGYTARIGLLANGITSSRCGHSSRGPALSC